MSAMTRACALTLILTALSSSAAPAQLRRSAEGRPPEEARRGDAVPVPRNPYAGKWDGQLELAAIGGEKSTAVTIAFAIVDEANQVYSGETTLGHRTQRHVNIGTTGATVVQRPGSETGVMPRSPGSLSETSASGPLDPNLPAPGQQLLLLYHSPSRTMLLCGLDHRCGDLPALRWEVKDADGRTWSFLAQLVAADTLAVAAVRREAGTQRETERTFLLARRPK